MKTSLWPALPYNDFKSTAYLLHRLVQMLGKLKLNTPFAPHWSNVPLWLTPNGVTTGLIPYHDLVFSIDLDFYKHEVICRSSSNECLSFPLQPMSVADLYTELFKTLNQLHIDMCINKKPQEISNPIEFDKDTEIRPYEKPLVQAWLKILQQTHLIMQRYHAKFDGESPSIGLMWGTFDLRDARYNGVPVPTTGINSGYIRRNAMNEQQIEAGFWSGYEAYQRPAFYSFVYPEPKNISQAKIQPAKARWETTLQEFVLDYDDLRMSKHPDEDLLAFFESCYAVSAKAAAWKADLITKGEPV